MKSNNSQDNLIFDYTRAEAIEDGLQVCVSDLFPSDTSMFKYPVYFTSEVWELCQQQGIIVWDICYMAAMAGKTRRNDNSSIEYSLIVEGSNITPEFFEDGNPCYRLVAQCGAKDIDDPTPVITIMFRGER